MFPCFRRVYVGRCNGNGLFLASHHRPRPRPFGLVSTPPSRQSYVFLICLCYDPSRLSTLPFDLEVSFSFFLAHHNLFPICYPPLSDRIVNTKMSLSVRRTYISFGSTATLGSGCAVKWRHPGSVRRPTFVSVDGGPQGLINQLYAGKTVTGIHPSAL